MFLRVLVYVPGADTPPGPINEIVETGRIVKSTLVRYLLIIISPIIIIKLTVYK
uniref:Uncharacterized protein n=1 Tax=viral metagenome TaxID=1070528 RepID=A0A6M3M1S3_9ZZZZ